MSDKLKFIIYATPYSEDSGGAIVLHKLCDLLNEIGYQAYIWPYGKPVLAETGFFLYCFMQLKRLAKYFLFGKFPLSTRFKTPIASKSDLIGATVIYPEIVKNNPLGAEKVIRWLLYTIGFGYDGIEYKSNELYFHFQEAFKSTKLDAANIENLMILDIRDDIYFQTNFEDRQGRCFILRKGKNRQLIHSIEESEIIDNLSHEELSKIFNTVEYCFSYDMHTMYSVYASLCGCKSVIVPDQDTSLSEWQPVEELRYGLAYGEGNIDFALNTKNKMYEHLKQKEHENIQQVKSFVKKATTFFKGHGH